MRIAIPALVTHVQCTADLQLLHYSSSLITRTYNAYSQNTQMAPQVACGTLHTKVLAYANTQNVSMSPLLIPLLLRAIVAHCIRSTSKVSRSVYVVKKIFKISAQDFFRQNQNVQTMQFSQPLRRYTQCPTHCTYTGTHETIPQYLPHTGKNNFLYSKLFAYA